MRLLSLVFVLGFVVSVPAQPKSVTSLLNQGTKFANAGEYEKALSRYGAALSEAESTRLDNAHLARLHYNLGVCEYHLRYPERAIEELNLAIKLKGDYARAFYVLGMAESSRANWQAARLAFLESLRLDRSNGEPWFDLAFAYYAEGDFTAAEAAFRNSIIHRSIDSAWSHNNVGVFLALRGEFSSAETEFEAALKASDGNLVGARNNLEYCRARERERSRLLGKREFGTTGKGARRFDLVCYFRDSAKPFSSQLNQPAGRFGRADSSSCN